MKKKFMFPLDIQLFADDNSGDGSGNDDQGTGQDNQDSGEGGQEIKTFTQEELDKIVQGRIAKERKAWEKHLVDEKTEAQKLETMSEKEKKKYQEEKRSKELDDREAAITRRELTAQAKVQLADKGIPTELAEILNLTDAESCKKSIEVVEKAFQSAVEKAVEEKIKGNAPMKKVPGNTTISLESIKNMSAKEINKETGEVKDISTGNFLEAVEIGSTSKAGTLYTGFKENIIVPNTYFVDEPLWFKGSTKAKKSYKTMGNINEIDALAWSSNVYMFRIAMKLAGVEYVPHGALNVDLNRFVKTLSTIRRDFGELGLGVKTGLDVPNESDGYKGRDTAPGHLLDACIGQYDTYTPIQLAQYTCTLANMGKKVQPHFLIESFKSDGEGNRYTTYKFKTNIQDDVSSQADAFKQIKAGMRACVTRTDGTSHTYWSEKPYAVYCKTGTAEKYDGNSNVDHPNHLQIGYISATEDSKPLVAFASIAFREDRSSSGADSSAPIIAHQVVDKYVEKYGLN